MPGLSAEFYADDADIKQLIGLFDELGSFQYVEKLSALNMPLRIYRSAAELVRAFKIDPEMPAKRPQYYVLNFDTLLQKREIKMADGSGTKESLTQYMNPDSIELRLGGNVGDDTLVMSDICSLGDTDRSREMHKSFKNLVTQNTKRVGSKGTPYRLMPGAVVKLKAGWRLAREKTQPAVMDPKISAEEIAAL